MTDYSAEIERDAEGRAVRLTFGRIPASEAQGGGEASGVALGQRGQPRGNEKRRDACLCAVCGGQIPARAVKHGSAREYCSPTCRRTAWERAHPERRQKLLPLDPPPAPVPPVADQRLDLAEEGKLKGDNALVLRRLRQGPATTAELAAAAPRSMAIHSRVSDVRDYLKPLGETVTRRRIGPRLHVYEIEVQR